jgi:hypothetical protein
MCFTIQSFNLTTENTGKFQTQSQIIFKIERKFVDTDTHIV